MAPTNKDSGVTRMAGAPMFRAVQHPELDTLGQVAIRDFLKKRARYLRLVAQNSKADGVNFTPITVVASIDPELLKNLIDMEKIDADSVDDCTDESVMEFLESTQERDASVTAVFVKAEVLAKVTFATSEKDPALRVMKAVADYYSLLRNLRLDFSYGKPKKAVEHLVSVVRPATLKALIESKLEIDKSELKKDFLGLVKVFGRDGYHTRRALSCCGAQIDWRQSICISIVHVKAVCFVLWYKAWSCMIKSSIRAFILLCFYTLFGHHEKSYENHGAAPGHHFKFHRLA
jgi:hypothetical protein